MKTVGWLIVGLLVLYAFNQVKLSEGIKTLPDYQVESNYKLMDKVKQERKVIEAFVTSANVLYVSVISDGTRRDGYASYLCDLISPYTPKVSRVKVVEHGTTKHKDRDNAYGILLGECWCK